MPLLQTSDLTPTTILRPTVQLQAYCGLDSCVALECHEALSQTHPRDAEGPGENTPSWPTIYAFERELQGPYLSMMRRGFAVDQLSRRQAAEALKTRIAHVTEIVNELADAVWSAPLIKPGKKLPHYTVLQEFFYKHMKLPEQWISQKGERKLSTNREVLEKLDQYLYARPFVNGILTIRDLYKQLSVFEEEIDADGRHRTSYNIAGTETGRPSSSENALGTGGNQQNISPSLRYVFVADPGMKLCVIDLEQVEARDVGFFMGCLFDDWSFLDACESGDLHTNNARRIWPELPWSDEPKHNRAIADRNFYREFSYRDMAKRGSHLSNYSGTAYTASRALKVPIELMEDFQARYCRGRVGKAGKPDIEPAFPGIPGYWQWCAEQLQTLGWLETPFGRRRHFFGRPGDDTTLREAIAFMPQSTTADRMNLGLWRVWRKMPQCEMLAQTYDSITFQYEEKVDEAKIIQEALELIRVELQSPDGRSYIVPGEAKVGYNWGNQVTQEDITRAQRGAKRVPRLNLDGLKKWSPQAPDTRQRTTGFQRIALG